MAWLGVLRRLYGVGFMLGLLVIFAGLAGLFIGVPVVIAGQWLVGRQLGDISEILAAAALGCPPVLGFMVARSPG